MEAEEELWAHSMEDVEFQQYLAEALATGAAEYGQKEPVSAREKAGLWGVGQTYVLSNCLGSSLRSTL